MDRRTLRKQRRSVLKVGDKVEFLCSRGSTKCACAWGRRSTRPMLPRALLEEGVVEQMHSRRSCEYPIEILLTSGGLMACQPVGLKKVLNG